MNKISIIIPLYNKERHIKETLKSVFAQTHSKYEVVLVDDGSTDKGMEIVKKFYDPRLRVFSIPNSGVSYARNFGILKAEYDLIAFLDADDIWLPNHLENLASLSKSFPNCGLYCTSYLRKSSEYEIKPEFKGIPNTENWEGLVPDFFGSSHVHSVAWTSAVMIPKRIFNLVGTFDTSITLGAGEDTDLWIRIAKDFPVAFRNQRTAIHMLSSDNRLSNSKTNNRTFLNIDKYSSEAEQNPNFRIYLEIQKFSIAIHYKIAGNQKKFSEIERNINKNLLNWKQRVLLTLPRTYLFKIKTIQKYFIKRNIYLSAYKSYILIIITNIF